VLISGRVHTMLDGDTLFALSTGKRRADVNIVGAFAAEAVARAIVKAVRAARPVAGLPSACSESPPPPATAQVTAIG
jgi:L-aminopeptidase/D-esterase-like protein